MDENPRLWMLSGVVVVILVVLVGGYLVFRGGGEHTVRVRSIPNDLTLTVDGVKVDPNGDLKLKSGEHTLVGERDGFETHTQTVNVRGDVAVKMFLFSNGPAGREWEKNHPDQVLETEAEGGRKFDEQNKRIQRKYPILQELPYVGPGFTVNYGASRKSKDDPETLAFIIKLSDSEGRKKSQEWLVGHGYDPSKLEIVYQNAPGFTG
ncbi:PEGA domain-containing protein [Kribbella amoyensis]|uniref:PEGA domain-containing protein n=1 Tax=Kribbella amoyensis TaxID=996641 RepID=A0A561BNB6_9ACTN|nr:PEGA domain-containing protein [Kribbella amoyensis]TWD80365.1 PEGA domain-containing protein [Kribbella amoyensis]